MSYCCKIECEVTINAVLKISSNAEIVCHEQTVMPRVASDLQSSSRRNSGGRRLVLKPLRETNSQFQLHRWTFVEDNLIALQELKTD